MRKLAITIIALMALIGTASAEKLAVKPFKNPEDNKWIMKSEVFFDSATKGKRLDLAIIANTVDALTVELAKQGYELADQFIAPEWSLYDTKDCPYSEVIVAALRQYSMVTAGYIELDVPNVNSYAFTLFKAPNNEVYEVWYIRNPNREVR